MTATKLRPLFEITSEMYSLIERLEVALDDESAELMNHEPLLQWLGEVDNQAKEKIDAYGWVIKMLETEADQAREIRDDFDRKVQVRKRRIDLLKDMLKTHLQATGQTKVEGKDFKVALQKNGGAVPVEIFDETQIPSELTVTSVRPNVDAIRNRLDVGAEVPGARLGERGQHVRIR